jgi:hypothetical protein
MAEGVVIPLATTSILVLRSPGIATADGDAAQATFVPVSSGVRAHFSAPSGSEVIVGGSKERIDRHLDCDLTDLVHTDRVLDQGTGVVYDVVWAHLRQGLGLDRIEAGVKLTTGLAG